ncbi:subtilisin-like protease SBT4.15 [Coffea arabica]|uniref:Subtilisin-like protease SBT4.15 n=1 Tax=Coffea arabica TaxID=13443 RepID=A0A6P6SJR8_COFAR
MASSFMGGALRDPCSLDTRLDLLTGCAVRLPLRAAVVFQIKQWLSVGYQTYIVYMGELPEEGISTVDEHHNLLQETIGNERIARESKIHSYGRSFNGFVARLLPHEAKSLSQKKGVVSVFPNTVQKLRTTRSWDFIGMPETVERNHQVESETIVAVLDTGIWIKSPSFNDEGYGPPPPKWKGKCAKGANFTGCNRKVIGAQYFNLGGGASDGPISPVDLVGHGTHTSSTAAGVPVRDASLFGLAEGTARGGVPSARIAMYKVCWGVGCDDMDLLAGFDAAIADGVDIISVSIGGPSRRFFEDPMAIGSFHALKRGILTSCSAGNSGPDLQSVENVAPWIMTVAASSIDRQFVSTVKLGEGDTISGVSINTFTPTKQMYPLTNGDRAANSSTANYGNVSACDYGTLSASKVRGNIVFCRGRGQDSTIQELGGVGVIMSADQYTDMASACLIPATTVNVTDGELIDHYINSTKAPKAVIDKAVTVNMTAPFIASFSSRGPQVIALNVLKPDVAAPGLDILAAYSQLVSLTGDTSDKRIVEYNILSGTSMACPHAAAAAAYVKTFHPKWSPAAIKSALMTTAKSMKIKPIGLALASGAGQINPRKALDPGLVYDLDVNSYVSFLCKEGYNDTAITAITGDRTSNCSSFPPAKGTDGLNYPSMHLQLVDPTSNNTDISAIFYRTVTYVGEGKTVYRAKVKSPKVLSVTVVPKVLSFTKQHQKRSFKVMVKGNFVRRKSWLMSASLVWSNCRHNVKSPVLIYRPPV